VGTQLSEQQTMNGLLKFGETEKIIERRSFSLLDMKRFVGALGLESGGYKGEFSDLVTQAQPAIVPISYAGFKHFVVFKAYKNGRVYVADPALGNISFDEQRFKDIWENNTLFLINVAPEHRKKFLALQDSDLRHVEDATVNRYAFVDLQYPQFYMDKIADKASTIRLDKNLNEESENFGKPTYNFLRLYYKSK
jgi:predicted double-glycine peptidase